jgi:hypothetical protein
MRPIATIFVCLLHIRQPRQRQDPASVRLVNTREGSNVEVNRCAAYFEPNAQGGCTGSSEADPVKDQ